jgi:hypothetical protein
MTNQVAPFHLSPHAHGFTHGLAQAIGVREFAPFLQAKLLKDRSKDDKSTWVL